MAAKKETKTIGMGIETPDVSNATPDVNCPFTGSLKVRGNVMRGEVVSAKSSLSATIKVERQVYLPKYKRYKKMYSKVHAHNPAVIDAKEGDVVEFVGCKPISKTKSSVIVKVVSRK